jgi:hypothetical protein
MTLKLFEFMIEDNFGGVHTIDVIARDQATASKMAIDMCIRKMSKKPCALWFKILSCFCNKESSQTVEPFIRLCKQQKPDRILETFKSSQNPISDMESSKIHYLNIHPQEKNPE